MLSWLIGLLSLGACAGLIVVLSPGMQETLEVQRDTSTPRPAAAESTSTVDIPIEVITGRFNLHENREWTLDELAEAGGEFPDSFPSTWGAGEWVPEDAKQIALAEGQSIGYLAGSCLHCDEAAALAKLPRLSALKFDYPHAEMTDAELQHLVETPGLRCLATSPGVLARIALPKNIVALSLTGAPVRWDFPWVTSFEAPVDSYGFRDPDGVPTPLPTNLDSVETLILFGWPARLPLPASLRRLQCSFIAPAALVNAPRLEWMNEQEFEGDGDLGLEVFSQYPWMRRVSIDCSAMTDAGLAALSSAVQIEELHLNIDYDTPITAVGLSALSRLPRLKYLEIEGGVTDAMLEGLRGCAALETLDFGYESLRVRGEGLAVMRDLPSLKVLDISGCKRFTGAGARHLAGLKLEVIHDFGEYLTDAGCREVIANWPGSGISFRWCDHLTDAAFEGLENAQGIRVLDLQGCDRISRKTLDRVLSLAGLEKLYIGRFKGIDDGYLTELAELPELRVLDVNGVEGTERGLLALLQLPKLSELHLSCAGVTTGVIQALANCRELKSVELPSFYTDDEQYAAVWALIDARPDLHVYAISKGNPYDPKHHP